MWTTGVDEGGMVGRKGIGVGIGHKGPFSAAGTHSSIAATHDVAGPTFTEQEKGILHRR